MLRVLSLFSGCGGLDIPFKKNRYKIVNAIDNDPEAIRCLEANLNCNATVMDVTSEGFERELQTIGKVDVVLGGFPCQGFSKSGPKREGDPRNKLYLSMIQAVEMTEPEVFIAENVDGMAQNFNGKFVNQITEDFYKTGYSVTSRILNAVNFGVPQFRRRIFFVGTRSIYDEPFIWPEPTHYGATRNGEFKTTWDVQNQPTLFQTERLLDPVTIGDAISDLIELNSNIPDHNSIENISIKDQQIMARIGEGQKLCNVRFSDTSVYTWNIPDVFGETTAREKEILLTIGKNRRKKIYGNIPNGNPLDISVISELSGFNISEEEIQNMMQKGFLKKVENQYDLKGAMFCSGLYKRPLWDEPAPTVLTVYDNPRYFFHSKEERPFTVRECARLQSFPDDFIFVNTGISNKDAYRLIGNAVPPKLAGVIEEQVWKYITRVKKRNAAKDTSY